MNMTIKTEQKLTTGYYWVESNYGADPEIAYYSAAKKWLYIGSQISFTPFKVIERVNKC